MEMLDIVDINGSPTGEVTPRETAHEKGLLHRTSHVWLFRRFGGSVEILMQKRSRDKDSYPGCYDISSAGHIPAGQDYVTSALRELSEELGISAKPEELIYCGRRTIAMDDVFYGKPFHDRQVSAVFALNRDMPESAFTLQESEVESVKWIDYAKCLQAVKSNAFPNCIYTEELEMLRKAF